MTSKQVEQLLNQAQIYQQQIQAVLAQKNAIMMELNEIEKALEEIEKTKEKSVYRITGPILIKQDTQGVRKDLKTMQEFLNMRIGVIGKQEGELKNKIEDLRTKLTGMIPKNKE